MSEQYPGPEAPFLLELAKYAKQLEQQQFDWGTQQFAQNSGLTDQVVNNYLQTQSQANSGALNDISRYRNIFQPEENQLVNDANSFSSADRVKSEMGRAEAGVAQNMDQQRANATRDLQSYGIDPSAGRFAALDKAERTQQAAATAGAGNQARLATEATGRALRSEAIQVGQRYPGQIATEQNIGLQSNAGAENAKLANSNLGKSLLGGPTDWAGLAAGLRYPPVLPASIGGGKASSGAPSARGGGGSDSGAGGSGGSSGQGGYNGMGTGGGASPGYSSSTYGTDNASGADSGTGTDSWWQTTLDPGAYQDPSAGISGEGDFGNSSYYGDPQAGNQSGDTSWDQSFNSGYTPDWGGGGGDMSGYSDFSSGDSNMAYADGGPIDPAATTGGFVSHTLSPSGGAETDDIDAKLNANEFVIPRDVALWKGQEFFQNLIKKSRENATGAPAKPKMKAAA